MEEREKSIFLGRREQSEETPEPPIENVRTRAYGADEVVARGLGRSKYVSRQENGVVITERAQQLEELTHRNRQEATEGKEI